MEQPPRDIQQRIQQLMTTDLLVPQPEEEQLEQLRQNAIRLTQEINTRVNSLHGYYLGLLDWHTDLQRREAELQALREEEEQMEEEEEEGEEEQTEEQTTFTEEEIGAGKCYFRVLKRFEKYANKPYKNIWTRYNNLRKQIKWIATRLVFPEQARNLAKALLEEMEKKVCPSVQDVIYYTTHVYQVSLRIAGYLHDPPTPQDLKNAARELHNFVRNEIGN